MFLFLFRDGNVSRNYTTVETVGSGKEMLPHRLSVVLSSDLLGDLQHMIPVFFTIHV
jgi:hypothetical protein